MTGSVNMLYLQFFLRKGVLLGHVGRNQDLKDRKDGSHTPLARARLPPQFPSLSSNLNIRRTHIDPQLGWSHASGMSSNPYHLRDGGALNELASHKMALEL